MTFRAQITRRDPLMGLYASFLTADLIEMIGADWDWVWIDLQHGAIEQADVAAIARAALAVGCAPVVRVPEASPTCIDRVLEAGASGLIVPQVNSASDARLVVAHARFPPHGRRSVGSQRLMAKHGRSYWAKDEQQPAVIVQIESAEALANATEIGAVEGVDALLLGIDDLAAEAGKHLNFPGDFPYAREMLTRVAVAAAPEKAFGCFCDDEMMLKAARVMGASLLVCGEDWLLLRHASRAAAAQCHHALSML